MPIVNYAKEYRMFRILIKSPSQPPLMPAVKKTRVQADNFDFGK